MKNGPVIVERVLGAPVPLVWKALTDKDEMKKWYFDIAAFRPEVGFEFTFEGRNEKTVFIHLCRICEAIPEKKLSYTWQYEGLEGVSVVTFELSPEGGKTRLRLTHEGLETFPQGDPDFKRENFEQGWSAIVGQSLPKYLESQTESS